MPFWRVPVRLRVPPPNLCLQVPSLPFAVFSSGRGYWTQKDRQEIMTEPVPRASVY